MFRWVRKLRQTARRTFRQRIVYPWQLPSVMRKHIYTGAMGGIYFTLVSGTIFVYFGTALGMTPFLWGIMGGVGSFLLAAQILSAVLTQQLGHRKLLWFASAMAGRLVRLLSILGAFWLWHAGSRWGPAVLIVGVCLDSFFSAVATPPWLSWLADLIPEEEHGGFMGRRSAWICGAIICVVLPASLILDHVPAGWQLGTAVAVFVAATGIGLVDLVIHGTLPEPAMVLPASNHFLPQLLAPLRDRGFRPWLVFNVCWTFSMTLGGALATIFFVEDLEIKRNFFGGMVVLTAVPLVAGAATSSWTGNLVDRVGTRRMLMQSHLWWAILPLFWVFATPRTALWWLSGSSLLGGLSGYAAMNASNKLLTRFPPPEHRAMYVAVSACLSSLAGGLGVFAAGAFLHLLKDWQWTVAGWTFIPFHLLFVTSAVLRLASALLILPRIHDAGSSSEG